MMNQMNQLRSNMMNQMNRVRSKMMNQMNQLRSKMINFSWMEITMKLTMMRFPKMMMMEL